MVLVPATNNALVDAISQVGDSHKHGIVAVPDREGYVEMFLVDASRRDGRYLTRLGEPKRVSQRDIKKALEGLRSELRASDEGSNLPRPVVFVNSQHQGAYCRCWKSIDPETWRPFLVDGKQIVVPYNPTVC